MITDVVISNKLEKKLKKLPQHILVNLKAWVENVSFLGLEAVRKVPGYHDEPLKGARSNQRSIRLSRNYRAIYSVQRIHAKAIIIIKEVSNHEY